MSILFFIIAVPNYIPTNSVQYSLLFGKCLFSTVLKIFSLRWYLDVMTREPNISHSGGHGPWASVVSSIGYGWCLSMSREMLFLLRCIVHCWFASLLSLAVTEGRMESNSNELYFSVNMTLCQVLLPTHWLRGQSLMPAEGQFVTDAMLGFRNDLHHARMDDRLYKQRLSLAVLYINVWWISQLGCEITENKIYTDMLIITSTWILKFLQCPKW